MYEYTHLNFGRTCWRTSNACSSNMHTLDAIHRTWGVAHHIACVQHCVPCVIAYVCWCPYYVLHRTNYSGCIAYSILCSILHIACAHTCIRIHRGLDSAYYILRIMCSTL